MTICAHSPPRSACRRCNSDWPARRPTTLPALLRSLSIDRETVAIQRLHIAQLWQDPEYRAILEPLARDLRASGLL